MSGTVKALEWIHQAIAAVSRLLDSNVSGDIYRCMHPMTYVALNQWRKKFFKYKKRRLKLDTYLAKLNLSKYLGPHKVSACWSSGIFTAAA